MSLFRVGVLTIDKRRELCLIRNVSAGGMLIRAYCEIADGARVAIELKHGESIAGTARWTKDECVGITFDEPIDVLALLSSSEDGPTPRMPRVEINYTAWARVGSVIHRTQAIDISQGGLKVEFDGQLPLGAEVVVSLAGLGPCTGVVRWNSGGTFGITFNRALPLAVLVAWLQERRGELLAAG